ncbi:restriction endonuclease subunit S [Acinetobacter baumannii]|nr:restriction endonuclease subunit S [Acinetobacter baumannii]HEC0297640.1 restriction endonuclease subunit S [Acinetobacter baumannii]
MTAPKLRFKEFDGNWDIYALEDQIDFLAGYAFDSKLMSNDIQKYQLIKMSNVYQNQLDLTRNSSYWEKIDKKTEKFLLKKGDIVLTLTGTVGKTDYGYNVEIKENDKFLLNQRLVRLRGKIDFSLSKFVQYRISTDKFFYHFFNSSKGGTGNQSNVSIEDLKLLELSFPSKAEQTKIATFLSAVDEKINQLTQKHQLLSQYKQGMMQKLFSQQIRFKADDGSEFGAWESKKLNEIGQSFNGLVGKSKEDFGEGEAYITYKQIFDHRKINLNNVNFVNIQPNDTQNMVKKGDLFFTTSSETAHEVAYCSAILDDFEFPLYLNSFCFGYRPNSANILNSIYASFYFRSEIFRNKIKHLAQGSTRFNISKTAFMNVVIHLPMLEEQTKIANFLSSIDQKIDVVSDQIEQAKQWKKGLLQQMFV